jgi:predicted ATPase/DNA-binding SARP family transcriptional activator
VEIRVLGSLEIVGADGPVSLGAGKQRRLLAALAIRAGEGLPSDVLIDAVWGASPPASATKLLQVYVSQLRKALEGPVRIHTRGAGYALEVGDDSLDAARFERLLGDGRAAILDGNAALAVSLLRRALALWRGLAYGEFAYEEFARGEAERLEELRLVALEERISAELALGRHGDVLPELQSLAAAHPLRERLQAQAMLALYRSGRQTEALGVYTGVRVWLREELGLEPGSELRELQRRVLEHDPTLAVAPATAGPSIGLPAAPNALLGRERELSELSDLLARDDVRLLVLTGAGGSGKTRLALEVARVTAASFANGAAFVQLAPLSDPALVPGAIARALAIREIPGEEPLDTLATVLRGRELLLVLDTAEHLRVGARIFSELLARAPRTTLLVTSRAVLHLSGEHVYPVQPLGDEPAVALFHQRSCEADPSFPPEPADEQAIRRVCARLDGLPLAIELAAARTRILTPRELLERLDPRLPLLTGGPRDLPARQQTLRATLEWSFDLLSSEETHLFARLAVFVGSFDREAATAVCDADIDGLTALLEQSLLARIPDGRFLYLDTIREFALERLAASPEADEVHRRHLTFFLALAESADLSAIRRAGGGERLDIAIAAQDNVAAALAWAVASGSVALGLELAIAMERFWVTHDPREGMRWFGALLGRPEVDAVAPGVRADALRAYGGATGLGGQDEAAELLYEESLALFDGLGDEHGRAVILHRIADCAMRRGDLVRARGLVETSHQIHERAGNRWGQAQTLGTRGAIARDAGEEQRAFELIEMSAAMAREAGVHWWESGMLAELANLSLNASRIDDADMQARESLAVADQIGDHAGRVFGVGLLARVAAERGQTERAVNLWAAIQDADAIAPLGGWRRHHHRYEARMHETVGGEALRAAADHPRLTLDDAVTLALRSADRGASADGRTKAG